MNQEDSLHLPGRIQSAHHSLKSFLKQAQDVTDIRRVLALHLSSHMKAPISHPLSLLVPECEVRSASSIVRGLRKDYFRCVRANIKAREEYEEISSEHRRRDHPRGHDSSPFLESFLEDVQYGRKHGRLRILHDYIDMLAQRPAAAADHLDLRIVLKDIDSLPLVPSDVMSSTGQRLEPQRADLNDLVKKLEKSVLKAKVLLKKENKLLSKVRAERTLRNKASMSAESRLQALGTARNELISWIETELAKASESPAELENQNPKFTEKEGEDYVDRQLSSIQKQYAQYTEIRQTLIVAATGSLGTLAPATIEDDTVAFVPKETAVKTNFMNHVLHTYLRELTSLSNQQKSMIHQKSHLIIGLAKQVREASHGLDRLAEESHLLSSYPLAGSQRKDTSFGEEISNYEKPDSCHKARAWVHASELGSKATKEVVAEKLEEGEVAISEARQTLLDLQHLLGEDIDEGRQSKNLPKDVWATLGGHLGVIKGNGIDEVKHDLTRKDDR